MLYDLCVALLAGLILEALKGMKTREQFIKSWRAIAITIGMDALAVLRGQAKEAKADVLLDLPSQIDTLLGRIYDNDVNPVVPANNGQPTQVKK